MKKPETSILNPRMMKKIMNEEGVPIEELFFARYDPLFWESITKK